MTTSAAPSARSPRDDTPIRSDDDLVEIFHSSERPRDGWRIGAEAEKFGVDAESGAPLAYSGERGVTRVMQALADAGGWQPERETDDGPVIALKRGDESITLEPGAQLELSGAPLGDVHGICSEMQAHLAELADVSRAMNLTWLGVGFHPLARQADLPWVPKHRYAIMRDYLPARGSGALDMMRRTATVQANFDYANEEDALAKLCVALRLSPLVNAMTANSPFLEGRLAGRKSVRGVVWLSMDPERSGLIPSLWKKSRPSYRDYVEWALDAGMFLFKRGDEYIANTGQPFRSFLQNGFQGHRATRADWRLHLNTLFPEARLKSTLEVRSADSLPLRLACGVPALFTGILYDARALSDATELALSLDLEAVERSRPALVRDGLAANIGGRSARELAQSVIEIASGGLERRARLNADGRDERVFLEPLAELVNSGRSPADLLTDGLERASDLRAEILRRCRI
jgi:glutamate--cysteine ligase